MANVCKVINMHYNTNDTIVAISTPAGFSSLGIVRLSGEKALTLASKIFVADDETIEFANRRMITRGKIYWQDKKYFAPVYLLSMVAPRSYTGENVVEIITAGAEILLNTIIDELSQRGARRAQAGEFTWRAFFHGRLLLSEVNAIAQLISTADHAQRREAVSILRSGLSGKIAKWREQLRHCAGLIEAELDFSEDEIAREEIAPIADNLLTLINESATIISAGKNWQKKNNCFSVGLVGLTNVGKSSLFNRLLADEIALTASEKSTTRDQLTRNVQGENLALTLTDCPGDDFSAGGVAEILRGRNQQINYDFSLLLVIIADAITGDTENFLRKLPASKIILVHNKSDLFNNEQAQDNLQTVSSFCQKNTRCEILSTCLVSAKTNAQLDQLKQAIINAGLRDLHQPQNANEFEIDALSTAQAALTNGLNELNNHHEELAAFELRNAHHALGALDGENYSEAIINNIFSRFCIGK